MILLHNVVEILDLTDGNRGAVLGIVALDGRFVGRTPVDGNLLRHPVAVDRLFQKAERRRLISVLRQEKVNGLPRLIHCTIEIVPLAFNLDVRLIHAPAEPHRPLPAMKRRFQQGTVFHDPTLNGRVVDRHATFLHEFFDVPVAQGIGHIPPHTHQNNLLRKMGSFETDRHRRAPSLRTVGHRERP
jgi:hypothetical protein